MSRWLILSSLTLSSGTGIRLKGIANGLVRNGHVVYLVGGGDHGDLAPGVNLIRVRASLNPVLTAFRLLFANFMAAIRIRPEFCIASKPLPHSVLPALLARTMGSFALLDCDDLESGYWKGRPWQPLFRLMESLFPRFLQITCIHTQELAEEVLVRAGLKPWRVIRLNQGVEASLFTSEQKEKYHSKPVVLYAAHLGVAAEGLRFVLEGFRHLANKDKDVTLLVVGSGPLLPTFQAKARELELNGRVVFAGFIPHRLMPEVMGLATAAVNYAPPENSANRYRASVKVREYLAMGLPIATNLVGSDLVPLRPFLQVFEAGDLNGFAIAVARALSQEQPNEACREIKRNLAWEVVIVSFLREFQQQTRQSVTPH